MRRTARLSAATAVLGAAFVVTSPAAFAQTADYTGTGDTAVQDVTPVDRTSGTGTGSSDTRATRTSARPATLPFTGGEVVLIAVAGGAAVVAGAAMVAGGRRRAVES